MSRNPDYQPVSMRVAVVADDALTRTGLIGLIERELELTGGLIVESVDEADAVLLAIATGGEAAVAELADIAVPVLAVVGDPDQVDAILRAGARGAILRDHVTAAELGDPGRALVSALAAICHGLVVVDIDIAERWSSGAGVAGDSRAENPSSGERGIDELTPREIEVLTLLGQGFSNRRIAATLDVSEHTAKFHISSILAKLGARTRTEAVIEAIRRGLLFL